MNLLLAEQADFDKEHFDRQEWQLRDWRDQKTRHIGLHISKAAFKLIAGDHLQTISQVIPDLSIYRAQLINTHDIPVDVATVPRTRHKTETDVATSLLRTNGELAYYLEPAEHGALDDELRISRVTAALHNLHVATESLGKIHGVDIEVAHLDRMTQLLYSGQ